MEEQQPLKIYSMGAGLARARAGCKWINAGVPDDEQLPHGHIPDRGNHAQGTGSGFWEMETPIFEISRKHGPRVSLLDAETVVGRNMWLISAKCKTVFEQVDPEAFEFRAVETRYSTRGKFRPGPEYWLCDVIQFLDVLDEEKSPGLTIKMYPGNIKRVEMRSDKLIFRRHALGQARIFRLFDSISVRVTEHFKFAVEGAALTNFIFHQVGEAV